MNDDARLPDDELASAYLDGELSADERALVDASPALTARVTQFAGLRDEIAEVPVAPATARDAALAAALAEFDALPTAVPAAAAPVAPVVRLRPRWTRPLLAAAAAVLFVGVAGVAVLGGRGSDDKASTSADKEMSAERSTDGGEMNSTGGGAAPSTIASITGSADAALQIASTEELLALAEMRDDAGTTMETMAASETSVAPAAETYAPESDQSLACPLGAGEVYLADILWMGTPAVAVLDTTTGAVSAIAADCTVLVTATP